MLTKSEAWRSIARRIDRNEREGRCDGWFYRWTGHLKHTSRCITRATYEAMMDDPTFFGDTAAALVSREDRVLAALFLSLESAES